MKTAPNLPRKARGFTLIEIAIVLVIIGLLLGGVLQGQQLIENSRVKSAVNDFNGIAAAMFSYQDRYGRLPGDDPGATGDRGDSWNVTDGMAGEDAGDGVLDAPATTAFDGDGEISYFFQNLRAAGFITGNPADSGAQALPQNPFGGLTTVVTDPILNSGTDTPLNGTKVCMSNVGGSAAIALDTQLDDGTANAGRFRASDDGGTANAAPAEDAEDTYTEDSSYTVCYRL